MATTYVIILAAGSGTRFGSDTPKQFLDLEGKPVVAHTIEAFRHALPDAEILLVLSTQMIPFWHELCNGIGFDSPTVVAGGSTRWESVKHGVEALADAPANATVLIHDGARPLVDSRVIRRVTACACNTDGAAPVIPITDSLRRLNDDEVSSIPVDRSRFRALQTPQAFTLWRLRQAYMLPYQADFTDDTSVLAAAGFTNIVITEGSPENIKITTPVDLLLASVILNRRNNS